MMRSLFAGVSALRNHQVKMDVIGNNIANVNTIGFKAATVTFKEQLSQTMKGAGAAQGGRGGTNPQQIGLGVDLGAISNIHTAGNLQSTGVESDVAIEGNGFFVLSDGTNQFFTRAGAFDFGEDGSLISLSHGLRVMGYGARDGVVDIAGGLVPVRLPLNQTIPPRPTTTTEVTGNLDARVNGQLSFEPNPMTLAGATEQAQVSIVYTPTGNFNEWAWQVQTPTGVTSGGSGTIRLDVDGNVTNVDVVDLGTVTVDGVTYNLDMPVGGPPSLAWSDGLGTTVDAVGTFTAPAAEQTSIRVIDSRGEQHDVIISFSKSDANTWAWNATDKGGNDLGSGTLAYNTDGGLLAQTGQIAFHPPGAEPVVIDPDFQALTQYAEDSDVTKARQNGFPAGTLTTISVDQAGQVNGSFSNGLTQTLAQIALADFSNPGGLLKAAGTLFQTSANSGQPDIGVANTGARGVISPGSLEMSNVDLSLEFTNMIITQRGFQANSRIITTSDEMLQELVNLKR